MIEALKHLVYWLEARFPAKVVVLESDYRELKARIEKLEGRTSVVEQSSVHVNAVKDLIQVIKSIKDEQSSLKASLGFSGPAQSAKDILATLNGEPISND